MAESFEEMLSGGHHNSLGRTIEVVDLVLADRTKFEDLFQCYFSEDELVRLRVSNGVRRVCKEQPEWVVPYIDRLTDEIALIDQASTQWTLAILFDMLKKWLTAEQREKALQIMKNNLAAHNDWIVLNNSMETLGKWSKKDESLQAWLIPHLERVQGDTRKSVSGRAKKWLGKLVK